MATQFDGEFRGEPAIITVIRRDDGREAIINHLVDGALYRAQLESLTDAVVDEYTFEDQGRNILRTLGLERWRVG